ncbi:Retrovirus-related Pol polyprotein from transposon TNT 1-94 [Dendrobium catenatum]|uniref:Retrovirus-related Pol polyprotein from transposon TNT 1-94 n=1 Tax=Dendrobium catenatum TaxID=906689 RepID=A0A2I0WIG1_9ASPA|nr:Retrovirus-related Pol polyprotein from transposon TNT 1-94 [Dendrobium catenatum]
MEEHLNNLNTMMSQLCSVGINFDDHVRVLLMLSSFLESWDELVTIVSNSSENLKFNFENIMGLVLNEEVRMRVRGESLKSTLNVEARGNGFREKSKRGRSKSKRGK